MPLQEVAAVTGDEGDFALTVPAPGSYEIACHEGESGSARATVSVAAGEQKQIVMDLSD